VKLLKKLIADIKSLNESDEKGKGRFNDTVRVRTSNLGTQYVLVEDVLTQDRVERIKSENEAIFKTQKKRRA
jgi:hypothetical protein